MARKPNSSSTLLTAIFAPSLLFFAYAFYIQMYPMASQQKLTRLEQQLAGVQAREVPVNQRVQVTEQIREKEEELKQVNTKLDELRRKAGELMRAEFDSMKQLQINGDMNQILAQANLQLVDDHPLGTRNPNRLELLASLTAATKQLGDTLTELSSDEADSSPIQLPPNLPRNVNPLEWIAEQRALRVGRFGGPKTSSYELKLVGDYLSMVSGLESVIDACPDIVVTSVGFEIPEVRTAGPKPLIWTVQVQLRPMTNSLPEEPASSQGIFAGTPETELGNTPYTALKPVINDDIVLRGE